MSMRTARVVGIEAASAHALAFSATVAYIQSSSDPQAPLIWADWATFDIPVSILYRLPLEPYANWVMSLKNSAVAHLLYFPHLVHGLLGTLCWYFLPRLLMPKRFGGVWGSSR